MKKLEFKIHWSFFLFGLFLVLVGQGLAFFYYLFAVVLHELGHAFVSSKLGYRLNVITLLPYGTALSGDTVPIDYKDDIKISVAGPIVNLILVILIYALWWIFPGLYSILLGFMQANLTTLIFNFLPVFPLDGGRVFLSLLSLKYPRKKAFLFIKILGYIITILFFILFFASIFTGLNYSLGMNAIFLLVGLFEDDICAYYQNTKPLKLDIEKVNKGVKLSNFAFTANSMLLDCYKASNKNGLNQFFVVDDNFKIKFSFMDKEMEDYILKYPVTTQLKTIMFKNNIK